MNALQLDMQDMAAVVRALVVPYEPEAVLAQVSHQARLRAGRDVLFLFGLDMDESTLEALCELPDEAAWSRRLLELWDNSPQTLRFLTSGSTGLPKQVVHPFALLTQEARILAPYFTGRRRVLSIMSPRHVFGFVSGILLPKALGASAILTAPLPTLEFFHRLASGDLLVAFPHFWERMVALLGKAVLFPDDLWGFSAGSPFAPALEQTLRALGLTGLREVYGATELSAVGVRETTVHPFTLLPFWRRAHNDGHLVRCAPTGEKLVCPIPHEDAEPLPVLDVLEWWSEQEFFVQGRKDAGVQVGGMNVFPLTVEECLRAHPQVADCIVRLMHPAEGFRLKAFVVPRLESPSAPDSATLRSWLAERLAAPAVPRSFTFGPELPRTPSGKPADWNIVYRDGMRP